MDNIEIYKEIKEKIIWLDLEPEKTLNLMELADSFGVSRNPITLALTRLETEGWVIRHGSHYMVSPLSLNRIKEITEIRLVMEVQANIWAMQRFTADELEGLKALKKKILNLEPSSPKRQIVELDFQIHRTIFEATKNRELVKLLDRILSLYLRFWLSIPRDIDVPTFFDESIRMIEGIETKNESMLREGSSNHIKDSVKEILSAF